MFVTLWDTRALDPSRKHFSIILAFHLRLHVMQTTRNSVHRHPDPVQSSQAGRSKKAWPARQWRFGRLLWFGANCFSWAPLWAHLPIRAHFLQTLCRTQELLTQILMI